MNVILKVLQSLLFIAGFFFCSLTMIDVQIFDVLGEDQLCSEEACMDLDIGRKIPACVEECYTIVSSSLVVGYILIGLAGLSWILAFIMAVAKDPSRIKGILIWLGGLGSVFAVSYFALSTGDDTAAYEEATGRSVEPLISHLSGAGLWMFYIMLTVTILAIIVSSVTRMVR